MDFCLGLFLLVVASFSSLLPSSLGAVTFSSQPGPGMVVVVDPENVTNIVLRWDYTSTSPVSNAKVIIELSDGSLTKELVYAVPGTTANRDSTNYGAIAYTPNQRGNGYIQLTIKNIRSMGSFSNNVAIAPFDSSNNYRFKALVREGVEEDVSSKGAPLAVYQLVQITSSSNNQTWTSLGNVVELNCAVSGKPAPNVTWTKLGSSFTRSGLSLRLENVQVGDVGIYQCTAYNGIGRNLTRAVVIEYSGCTDYNKCPRVEQGIEFTGLTWTANYEYPSIHTDAIKRFKNEVSYSVCKAYIDAGKSMYQCGIVRFRRGSVVAVVELQASEGSPSVDLEPLNNLIASGSLAGETVSKSLVSPTAAPTTATPTTESSSNSQAPPDTGARTSGLSDAALYSIIGVAAAVFIVIIIVLVIFFLKRKKPSGASKARYQTDTGASRPYKPPPPRDTKRDDYNSYDRQNANDGYPNGERNYPPPQYEPTAYAEPRQDDSEMEWKGDMRKEEGMWI